MKTPISIIGSGYVGTTVGCGFVNLGHEVIFYDIDISKINQLKKKYNATNNLIYAITNSDISFLCVPTPYDGKFDYSYILNAVDAVGRALKLKSKYHLMVIKSTLLPTSTEDILIPILNKYKKVGYNLGICYNPEFLTEISSTWAQDTDFVKNFFNEDRIVIGEYDKKSGKLLEEIYSTLGKPIFHLDLKTAELIKYASNCVLATKISYWNEIFLVCEKIGIDSNKVSKIVGMDPRIGMYGTVHGKAFGGKCLPKDLKSFIDFSSKYYNVKLLKVVNEINEEMKIKYGVRE